MNRGVMGVLITLPILISACGSAKPPVSSVKAPSPLPSPCPAPVMTTATPSLESLSCKLAVAEFASAPGQPPASHGGGFLQLPAATYSADPAAWIIQLVDPNRTGVWQTVATPVLNGDGGPTYDRPLRRWLPVQASHVSPDGRHYVYEDGVLPPGVTPGNGPVVYSSRLHVVDLTTGEDRVLSTAALPIAVEVVSYQADGVYLTAGCPEGCPPDANKLWRLDPGSGVVRKLTDLQGNGWMIANGAGWTAINEAPDGAAPRFEVVRVNLSDGSTSRWLGVTPPCTSSCRGPDAVGVDAKGNLLVELWTGDSVHLERVTAPEQVNDLNSLVAQSEGFPYFIGGVVDQHGTWFGTRQGLFLYSTTNGLRRVIGSPVIPESGCVRA